MIITHQFKVQCRFCLFPLWQTRVWEGAQLLDLRLTISRGLRVSASFTLHKRRKSGKIKTASSPNCPKAKGVKREKADQIFKFRWNFIEIEANRHYFFSTQKAKVSGNSETRGENEWKFGRQEHWNVWFSNICVASKRDFDSSQKIRLEFLSLCFWVY